MDKVTEISFLHEIGQLRKENKALKDELGFLRKLLAKLYLQKLSKV